MACPQYACNDEYGLTGGACGVPVCLECYWRDRCPVEEFASDGVRAIWAKAEEQAKALKAQETAQTRGVEAQT